MWFQVSTRIRHLPQKRHLGPPTFSQPRVSFSGDGTPNPMMGRRRIRFLHSIPMSVIISTSSGEKPIVCAVVLLLYQIVVGCMQCLVSFGWNRCRCGLSLRPKLQWRRVRY